MDSPTCGQNRVSVIIPTHGARNPERLTHMAKQIAPATEVIIVYAPLCSHQADIECVAGAKVVAAGKHATASECHAIGAQHATGNVLLFLPEEGIFPPASLRKYIAPLQRDYDLVLSAGGRVLTKGRLSTVRCACALLNDLLGQKQLGSASLETAPFSLTRTALEAIGPHKLQVPATALVSAVQKGLAITTVAPVSRERKSSAANQGVAKAKSLIFQEHAKAIQLLLQDQNVRGALPDGERHRILVQVPGLLHLRSVFYQHSREKEGDGWGAKRKERAKRARKRVQSRPKRSH